MNSTQTIIIILIKLKQAQIDDLIEEIEETDDLEEMEELDFSSLSVKKLDTTTKHL